MSKAKAKAKAAPPITKLPNTLSISAYIHCGKCLAERPGHITPANWSRTQAGFTREGLQVWCNRHKCNILHIHFEGQTHPANMTVADEEGEL